MNLAQVMPAVAGAASEPPVPGRVLAHVNVNRK
jgi:hypothetical protein